MKTKIFRFAVPDEKVSWDVQWEDYKPPEYNSEKLKGQSWADPEDYKDIKFNQVDGKLNRKSHMGCVVYYLVKKISRYFSEYKLDKSGAPVNPEGRTGLRGRGVLGKFTNH